VARARRRAADGAPSRDRRREARRRRRAAPKLTAPATPPARHPARPQILFVIAKPDVFKSPGADTYVIFGEAKIEDLSQSAAASQAQRFHMPDLSAMGGGGGGGMAAAARPAPVEEAEEEGEEVDEAGVEPKDIELVMTQAGVGRAKAVKALKAADGDIVSAIMELTL
jgi:nascent polypeptide-associated complex subunit alpha